MLAKVAVAGVGFGLVSRFFSGLTHLLQKAFARLLPFAPWRPAVGGIIIIGLVALIGTRDYLGLGVNAPPGGHISIVDSFQPDGATPWSWWWKIVFTAVTVGSGFKGGEVTPLFFVGATCGHAFGMGLHESIALFAALYLSDPL